MAFNKSELSQMAYTGANGGNAFWYYSNSDGDTVTDAGYFNDAAEELSVGDLIYDVDGAGFVGVSTISDGVVAVATVPGT
jgi:hypothetical protein